jgi:hypothetical protein
MLGPFLIDVIVIAGNFWAAMFILAVGAKIHSDDKFGLFEYIEDYFIGGSGLIIIYVFPLPINFYTAWALIIICLGFVIYPVKRQFPFLIGVLQQIVAGQTDSVNVDPDHATPADATRTFSEALQIPQPLESILTEEYRAFALKTYNPAMGHLLTLTMAQRDARMLDVLLARIPNREMLVRGETPLSIIGKFPDDISALASHGIVDTGFYSHLRNVKVKLQLPEKIRTAHHHIIAGSGVGKTQLMYNMVLDDLENDVAIVVIDSQRDTITNLSFVVPLDRQILVDPVICPPALNIFSSRDGDEQSISDALDLYEYIFSSLDAKLTGMQALVYRNLSRLCMEIPGATLATMRDLLRPNGTAPYRAEIERLGENAIVFFDEFERPKNNHYNETRQQVLRRIMQVLDTPALARMFGAPTMKLDIAQAIDDGKVILVNTDSLLLKSGAALLGRVFVALVLQAVMSKAQGTRKRVYLYIDEFGDYAEDSDILLRIFSQARKYELGLIVTHQFLGQLPPLLASSISANTSIKFSAGISAEELNARAKQMRVEPEVVDRLPPHTFLGSIRGQRYPFEWNVDIGRIDRQPQHKPEEMVAFHRYMQHTYGILQLEANPRAQSKPRSKKPPPDADSTDKW